MRERALEAAQLLPEERFMSRLQRGGRARSATHMMDEEKVLTLSMEKRALEAEIQHMQGR